MESKRIEALLEKYWEAETSLEEELELKAYFSQNEVPAHLEEFKTLFQYLKKEQNGDITLEDETILKQIEILDSDEKPKSKKVRMWYQNYAKIAAVLLFLVVTTYFINRKLTDQHIEQLTEETFKTPEEAFQETKKALQLLSKNLSKGKKEARKISVFSKAQKEIKNKDKEL